MCFDGVKRLCHIRGKLRKKVWINQSDIILVGLRDYQDARADVILKYSADEARNLKSYGEFPENVKINETVNFDPEASMMTLSLTMLIPLTRKMTWVWMELTTSENHFCFGLKKIFFSFSSEIPRLQNLIR